MKKRIILIVAIVILLGIVFIKPISFYMAIISNGYNPTKIEKYKTVDETYQGGKTILVIVKEKKENFNLILNSNVNSVFWHIIKSGETSSEVKPYSWIKWDEGLIEDGAIDTRTHKTIIYRTESNISIDTKKIPSYLEFSLSQYKDFSIVDIYTRTYLIEIHQLDISKLVY